ncbi:MAG: acyl carrier protein [Bacteroidales bacterium]|nr:acyl carrier protein [Bacteroidales bacterium]
MNDLEIKAKIVSLAKNILGDNSCSDDNEILHYILSESAQALEFVCLIEDEFNIEFEDEEIDIDFFMDYNVITTRILKHL